MDFIIKDKGVRLEAYVSIFSFLELASAMVRRTKKKDKAYSLLYQINRSWRNCIKPIPPSPKISSFQNLIDDLVESAINFRTTAGDTMQAHSFATLDIKYFITWNARDFKRMGKKLKINILSPKEILDKISEDNIHKQKNNYVKKNSETNIINIDELLGN